MARSAPEQEEDAPTFDPAAIQRNYRRERARRRARIERRRATQYAHLRFWAVVIGLAFLVALLGLTVWRQIQDLFGL